MSRLKVVMMGESGAGKTRLAMRLTDKKGYEQTAPTNGIHSLSHTFKEQDIILEIKDPTGKKDQLPKTRINSYKNQDVALYCVDLTRITDDDFFETIKQDIATFNELSSSGKIVWVGTKADLCLEAESRFNFIEEQLVELGVKIDHKILIGTPKKDQPEKDQINTLLACLNPSLANQELLSREQTKPAPKKKEQTNASPVKVEQSKGQIQPDEPVHPEDQEQPKSPLEEAKARLFASLEQISRGKKRSIERHILALERKLARKSTNSEEAIHNFIQDCQKDLEGEQPKVMSNAMKSVLSFAAAVFVTLLAAAIGFGIGFAAGLWSGPGAFLTGLAAGEVAAVASVTVCSSLGLFAGGLTAWGLFKTSAKTSTSEEMNAVNEFANSFAQNYSKETPVI